MKTMRRTALWHVIALMTAVLVLQGCGTTTQPQTQKQKQTTHHPKKTQASTAPQYFRGALPALDAVQFLSSNEGFVAGQGIVLATSDGGQDWTRIYQGSQTIAAVAFPSATQGYALTTGGQVLAWQQGGSQWQPLAGLPGSASAIWLSGTSIGQLLTTQGTLYRPAASAGAWQAESPKGVIAASFDGSTGWAVTGGSSTAPEVWLTQNGGASWSSSFSPKLGQATGWSATISSAAGTAWLLLTSSSGQSEHQPYVAYVTHDLGQHWQEILGAALFAGQGMYPAAPSSLYGLQAGPVTGGAQSAYFVSWKPGNPNDVLAVTATPDGGQSWQQLPVQGVAHAATPYFFHPLGVAALPGGTLWLVGSRSGAGTMLVSHDGGGSWQALTP